MTKPVQLTDDEIDSIANEVHDWFVRHPLGTTDEGYIFFHDWFNRRLEPFSNGYKNHN